MEEDEQRRRVLDLLRAVNVETDRFVEQRGTARGMHRTHLHALSHVLQARLDDVELTPGRLARSLNLSAPATTALLDRLEAAGHVTRAASARDGRSVRVEMTPLAASVAGELFGPLGARMRRVLDDFDDAEVEVVLRFLTATARAVTEAADAPVVPPT